MELINNYRYLVVHLSYFVQDCCPYTTSLLKKLTAYPHQHSIIVLLYIMCLETAQFLDIAIYYL